MGIQDRAYRRHFPTGARNLITDVAGVKVGHKTVDDNANIHSGVTAVIPADGNVFREKLLAASWVINGFGKTIGLVQIDELGTLETPILLTNTLSVGTVSTALVRHLIQENPDLASVNPVVAECNDGPLSDIRSLAITEQDAGDALDNARELFQEGSVGAGRGMTCYGLKGGIGSSSRKAGAYTIGTLALTNFGSFADLRFQGTEIANDHPMEDKGSCIILIATDAPLSSRQLKRLARRAQSGLARTGGYTGNGSGEIAIAFSTQNRIPAKSATQEPATFHFLLDDQLNPLFQATVESVEESILSSLWNNDHFIGRDGNERRCLRDVMK